MLKTAGLFAAVILIAIVALYPGSTQSPEAIEQLAPESTVQEESLVSIGGDASRAERADVEPPAPADSGSLAAQEAAPDSTISGLLVRGQVLTGEEPLQEEDCKIAISSLDPEIRANASAQIDSEGRFELVVAPAVASEGERVRAKLNGPGMFGTSQVELELRPDVLVQLPPTLLAHGRVTTSLNAPLSEAYIHLADADGVQFLGLCEVEDDGTFGLRIRPHPWVTQVGFTVYSNERMVLQEVVELAALTSKRGLHYDFEMALIELAVTDPEGRPVADAELILDSVPESAYQQSATKLDDTGVAKLPLPPKRFIYLVKAPGFLPKTGRFDAEPDGTQAQRIEVPMTPEGEALAEEDPVRLFGRVTLAGNKRVENAFVSVSAQAEAWSVAHALYFEGVRTDANGDYELQLPRPGVYLVTASHRDGPSTGTRPLSVMHDLRFDLDLTPESRITLRPTGAVEDLSQTHGLVEWQTVQTPGDSIALSRSGGPHSLAVRPDRSYRVMGRLIGTDLFGVTEVDEAAIAQARAIPVPFAQAPIATGILVDAAGAPVAGARVVASAGAGAYQHAPAKWRSAVTDEAGNFRVFALGVLQGERTMELVVSSGSWGRGATFEVDPSQQATLTLR